MKSKIALNTFLCWALMATSSIVTLVLGENTTNTTSPPTPAPTIQASYDPGNLNVFEQGLLLSQGLTARVIAIAGQPVEYSDGTFSTEPFHAEPDGAAVFADNSTENMGGWVYVSNSEVEENNGGVGAIKFDANGDVIEYKMLLTGSERNCNGGKTKWNTWISCEEAEDGNGKVWQVDPFGAREPVVITHGSTGGSWESFAHDTRDPTKLYAFLTEDTENGAVQRQLLDNPDYSNPWDILLADGPVDYLFLEPNRACFITSGTFKWIQDEALARENAVANYPLTEGMEMDGSVLRIISKELYGFFHLDLDNGTYVFESTLFDGQPDQSTTVFNFDGTKMIYFTEEADPLPGIAGAQVGVYSRNEAGEYVNIIFGEDYSSESTGVAFSPDGMHLYFSYQEDGYVFDVTRTDGLSFFDRTAPNAGGTTCIAQSLRNSLKSAWRSLEHWLFQP